MIGRILGGLGIATALTLGLELVHGLRNPLSEPPLTRLAELEPGILAIGVLLVWAFVVLFQAITNRFWLAATIVTALAAIIASADFLKMGFRGEPLFLRDAAYLAELGFLVENVGAGAAIAVAAIVVAIPLAGWAFARSRFVTDLRRRRPRRAHAAPRSGRRAALARVAAGAAAMTVIFLAGSFNWPGSPARALYEAAGADWRPWNQSQNYDDNGIIAGLLYTLPAAAMEEPEDYSREAMEDLVARYTQVAADLNEGRDADALAEANVVVILSESLSDPFALPGVTAVEDPLPFLRELMEENTSGTLISSGYGGGTANVEFEVLTGMAVSSFHANVDSPLQSLVADAEHFPSHLAWFGDGAGAGVGAARDGAAVEGAEAREASAIHPYRSNFYRRNAAYPALGFDRATFRDAGLEDLAKLPGDRHVSDRALYKEVVKELRSTDAPVFINAVSMQNHSPQQGLANPIPVEGPLSSTQADSAGQYLRGLKHSDDALRTLVADLERLDEPTVVLLYGDHLPSIWPEDLLEAAGPLARYQTPWVVFANFPLEKVEGGTMGANQLMNQVIDSARAPHSPWTALLDQVAAELPAMERTAWLDADGQEVTEEDLSPAALQLLADYRLAQYDLADGEGYATEALLAPVAP